MLIFLFMSDIGVMFQVYTSTSAYSSYLEDLNSSKYLKISEVKTKSINLNQ